MIIETDRMLGCAEIVANYYSVYQQTRFPEAYDVAVAAVNYLLTELPQKKTDFDTRLQQKIQDNSPPGLPSPTPSGPPTTQTTGPFGSTTAAPSATP